MIVFDGDLGRISRVTHELKKLQLCLGRINWSAGTVTISSRLHVLWLPVAFYVHGCFITRAWTVQNKKKPSIFPQNVIETLSEQVSEEF